MDHSIWSMASPTGFGATGGASLYIYGGTKQSDNDLNPSHCSTVGTLLRIGLKSKGLHDNTIPDAIPNHKPDSQSRP